MREIGTDSSIGSDPIGESILTVLDNGLASLISIVSISGLSWGDWSVIYELKEMLSVTSDDCKLLAVFTESIKLVSESSLELLTGDVGELSFGYKRLGFGTNKLLLKDDNLWLVWLLVLELSNLISDFLFSYPKN